MSTDGSGGRIQTVSGPANTLPPAPLKAHKRLALIYVHGMGDQWRLSDSTSILNNLETYWQISQPKFPLISKPERWTLPSGNDHAFLHTCLPNGTEMDLHEVYWAPNSPDVGAVDVLRWLRRQFVVPFLREDSAWAELSRLKLGVLGQAVATERIKDTEAEPLRILYKQFVDDKSHGTFTEFSDKIKSFEETVDKELERLKPKVSGQAVATQDITDYNAESLRLLCEDFIKTDRNGNYGDFLEKTKSLLPSIRDAVNRWEQMTRQNDSITKWVVVSMILATVVFSLFITEAGIGLFNYIQAKPLQDWAARYGMKSDTPIDFWFIRSLVAMTFLVTLGWLLGIQPFFRKYLGDAVQWATYHETSQGHQVRRAILKMSSEVIKKILVDDRYDRVVVLAHSLGSVIAHDTLLYIQKDPKNATGMKKITHFITYGSPIDKFAYFFETFQGQTPRYEQTVNDLRGSLFKGPAGRDLIWQNFYEEGDPIGGTIHTAGPSWGSQPKVQSVYTANANVALIGPNHTGYIANKMVLVHIWEALMPEASPLGAEPTQVDVMAHTRLMRQLYAMILLVPWALLASYIAHGAHVIQIMMPEHSALIRGILWTVVGLSIILFGLSKTIHLLKPAACTLFALIFLAGITALTAPLVATSPMNAAMLTVWSICVGLAFPALMVVLLLFSSVRLSRKTPTTSQEYQRPTRLLTAIIVILVVVMIITAIPYFGAEQALLPWWWWRSTFLYATFSLIILSALQLLWKGKPGHMLS